MRTGFLILISSLAASAAPRVDNVLIRMVPPGSTALLVLHMKDLQQTDVFRQMMTSQAGSGIDQFAHETGFDPRRDVNELLVVTTPKGSVALARGRFAVNAAALKDTVTVRHGMYTIWTRQTSGFCILDGTLAAAGEVEAIEAALDEWRTGKHLDGLALAAHAATADPAAQLWGVTSGAPTLLSDNLPRGGSGLDFSKLFRGLDATWFEGDLRTGFQAEVHGEAANEKDALNLRDAVRGMVGLGRLNVPDDQPDMLRVFDGITADQQGKAITIKVDIAPELVGKLLDMLNRPGRGPTRGETRGEKGHVL